MIIGSVCSGIGAPEAAWHGLGWRSAFLSEIAPFPRSVLAHRFPGVPMHGDFTTIQADTYEPIDILVGGTPCQSFSVAGLRGGMADERGNLALEYLRLADRLRPRWLVWENVPGVLSSSGGRDFGAFLGGLVQLGYGFAYRVLDAQHFGVPQRRRRVFVVGYLGDWRRAASVLFEPASLRRDTPPRREKGESVSPTISARPTGGGGLGTDFDLDGGLQVARCLTAHPSRIDGESENFIAHTLRGEGFDASEDGTGRGVPLVAGALTNRIDRGGVNSEGGDRHIIPAIAFDCKASGRNGFSVGDVASTQRAMGHSGSHQNGGGHQAVMVRSAVRRLTPREYERLQGFPDDWTLVPHRRKPAADGPRYKALGNSMAVPVLRWIGERIQRHQIGPRADAVAGRQPRFLAVSQTGAVSDGRASFGGAA